MREHSERNGKMLTQYQFHLKPDQACRVQPEWSYQLYAALLQQAPVDFGTAAHWDVVTPISQYLHCRENSVVWTVSLLGESAEQTLGTALERLDRIELTGKQIGMRVEQRNCRHIADAEQLFLLAAGHQGLHRLEFLTPTAFKSQGQYVILPNTRLILQSLIKKWNGCILECPIDDADNQGLERMAAGLLCQDYRLQSGRFTLKGHPIPGFTGQILLENRLSGFHRQMTDALLLFAEYAGIGIKTTLGMGGVARI